MLIILHIPWNLFSTVFVLWACFYQVEFCYFKSSLLFLIDLIDYVTTIFLKDDLYYCMALCCAFFVLTVVQNR